MYLDFAKEHLSVSRTFRRNRPFNSTLRSRSRKCTAIRALAAAAAAAKKRKLGTRKRKRRPVQRHFYRAGHRSDGARGLSDNRYRRATRGIGVRERRMCFSVLLYFFRLRAGITIFCNDVVTPSSQRLHFRTRPRHGTNNLVLRYTRRVPSFCDCTRNADKIRSKKWTQEISRDG